MSEIFIFLRVFNKKNQVPLIYRTVVRKKKEIRTLFNIWTKNICKQLTKEGI